MADITSAIKKTLSSESIISNDWHNIDGDSGGETYRGISRKNFPAWAGWDIIDNYKSNSYFPDNLNCNEGREALFELVSDFYNENFFIPLHLNEISSQIVADELFDTAVNMGISTAGTFLQRALNLLNKNGEIFSDLSIDGKIGPITIRAINEIFEYAWGEKSLLKVLNGLQFAKYIQISEKTPALEKFFRGWLRRINI